MLQTLVLLRIRAIIKTELLLSHVLLIVLSHALQGLDRVARLMFFIGHENIGSFKGVLSLLRGDRLMAGNWGDHLFGLNRAHGRCYLVFHRLEHELLSLLAKGDDLTFVKSSKLSDIFASIELSNI